MKLSARRCGRIKKDRNISVPMKLSNVLNLATLFVLISAGAQNPTSVKEAIDGKRFAHVESPNIIFDVDTIAFKKYISGHVLYEDERLHLDRIEIREKISIGDKRIPFHIVVFSDLKRGVNVFRWLAKKGNDYFFSQEYNFHQFYFTCVAGMECDINYFIEQDKIGLLCGTETNCAKPGETLRCTASKTAIFED